MFPSSDGPVFFRVKPQRVFYITGHLSPLLPFFGGKQSNQAAPPLHNKVLKDFKAAKATFGFYLISQQHLIMVYSVLFEAPSSLGSPSTSLLPSLFFRLQGWFLLISLTSKYWNASMLSFQSLSLLSLHPHPRLFYSVSQL